MTPDLALVVLFGALGGSLFGYDLGLIGGVLASLNGANATRSDVSPPYPDDTIYLDEIATELVVGGCKVGAALGVLSSAVWRTYSGRSSWPRRRLGP